MPVVADRPVRPAPAPPPAGADRPVPRPSPVGPPPTPAAKAPGREDFVVLKGVSWETYLALADAPENRHARFTYDATLDGGLLEIEMPAGVPHETVLELLKKLIVSFLDARGADYEMIGTAHLRRPRRRGLQADGTYYLTDPAAARAAGDAALRACDPPPDLAVEVVFASDLGTKWAIYAELGVRELWVWRAEEITVHLLEEDGTYREADASPNLPDFPREAAADLIRQRGILPKPELHRRFLAALPAPPA